MNLESIYHKGQKKIWDGREILPQLILEERSKCENTAFLLSSEERSSLIKILSIILRGEDVAWRVSSTLASQLSDPGARMAATSQSHDEARHFYVMRDYIESVLDHESSDRDLPREAQKGLQMISSASSLAAQLLGMQLLVEPVAITLFQKLREARVEPVLSRLLNFYERDEARHIALGVKHLPDILSRSSWFEILRLAMWQARVLRQEAKGLREIAPHLRTLGIDPVEVFAEAERRQIEAVQEMEKNLPVQAPLTTTMRRVFAFERTSIFSRFSNPVLVLGDAFWSAVRA